MFKIICSILAFLVISVSILFTVLIMFGDFESVELTVQEITVMRLEQESKSVCVLRLKGPKYLYVASSDMSCLDIKAGDKITCSVSDGRADRCSRVIILWVGTH